MVVSAEPVRVRLRFAKQGDLRLLGHRDLSRVIERLLRRAAIPVRLSEGFHPKPRIMYPAALALGVAGLNEVLEMDLSEPLEISEILARMNRQTLPGLSFHEGEVIPPGAKKVQPRSQTFELRLPGERLPAVLSRLEEMQTDRDFLIVREGTKTPFKLHDYLQELSLSGDVLRLKLMIPSEAGVRPRDVLAALGISEPEAQQWGLLRLTVEVH